MRGMAVAADEPVVVSAVSMQASQFARQVVKGTEVSTMGFVDESFQLPEGRRLLSSLSKQTHTKGMNE